MTIDFLTPPIEETNKRADPRHLESDLAVIVTLGEECEVWSDEARHFPMKDAERPACVHSCCSLCQI